MQHDAMSRHHSDVCYSVLASTCKLATSYAAMLSIILEPSDIMHLMVLIWQNAPDEE